MGFFQSERPGEQVQPCRCPWRTSCVVSSRHGVKLPSLHSLPPTEGVLIQTCMCAIRYCEEEDSSSGPGWNADPLSPRRRPQTHSQTRDAARFHLEGVYEPTRRERVECFLMVPPSHSMFAVFLRRLWLINIQSDFLYTKGHMWTSF